MDAKHLDSNPRGSINNIAELNFEPKLSYLFELFKTSNVNSNSLQAEYSTVSLPDKTKYNVEIKKAGQRENNIYSIELKSNLHRGSVEQDEDEFKNAMDTNNQFYIAANNNGTVVYCTDIVKRSFQNRIKNLTGKKLADVLNKYLPPVENEKLKAAIFDGRIWQSEIHIKDGKEKLFSLKLLPVFDEEKRVKKFIVLGNDIIHHLKDRTTYERVVRLTKAVIDNIPGLVAVFRERDDTIILGEANEKFIETFQLRRRSDINRDINTIFQTDFLKHLRKVIDAAFVKRSAYFEYTHGGNNTLHYGAKIVCLNDVLDDNRFYILNMRDMTNILEYEKQLKTSFEKETYLSKLKTSFLLNMALEIRTPYNSIMAYSDLIDQFIKEGDYDSVKELLDSTKDILKKVFKLFNNVTEVAQIESGDVHLKYDIVNCNEVVRIAYVKMKDEVSQKKLDFELDLFYENLVIKADWAKIEHILMLLLDNSIKYSSKGKIILGTEKKDDSVVISILDTGKGISEEELAQITEAFNVQEAEVGNLQGAGLGLTIVYNYTKLMGGSFNIQSKSKKGTKITLSFPLFEE